MAETKPNLIATRDLEGDEVFPLRFVCKCRCEFASGKILKLSDSDKWVVGRPDGFSEPNEILWALWVEMNTAWVATCDLGLDGDLSPWRLSDVKGIYQEVFCANCASPLGRYFPVLLNSKTGSPERNYAKLVVQKKDSSTCLAYEFVNGRTQSDLQKIAKLAADERAAPTTIEDISYFQKDCRFYLPNGLEQSWAATEASHPRPDRFEHLRRLVRRFRSTPQWEEATPSNKEQYVISLDTKMKKWMNDDGARSLADDIFQLWPRTPRFMGAMLLRLEREPLSATERGHRAHDIWIKNPDIQDCAGANMLLGLCGGQFPSMKDKCQWVRDTYKALAGESDGRIRDDTLGALKDQIHTIEDAIELIEWMKTLNHPNEVVVMSGSASSETAGGDPRTLYRFACSFAVRVAEVEHFNLIKGIPLPSQNAICALIEAFRPQETSKGSPFEHSCRSMCAVVVPERETFSRIIREHAESIAKMPHDDKHYLENLSNLFRALSARAVYFEADRRTEFKGIIDRACPKWDKIFKTEGTMNALKVDFHTKGNAAAQFFVIPYLAVVFPEKLRNYITIELVTGRGNGSRAIAQQRQSREAPLHRLTRLFLENAKIPYTCAAHGGAFEIDSRAPVPPDRAARETGTLCEALLLTLREALKMHSKRKGL